MDEKPCPRCEERPPAQVLTAHGLCYVCMRIVTAEIEAGLAEIDMYLERHAGFNRWLAAHNLPKETDR